MLIEWHLVNRTIVFETQNPEYQCEVGKEEKDMFNKALTALEVIKSRMKLSFPIDVFFIKYEEMIQMKTTIKFGEDVLDVPRFLNELSIFLKESCDIELKQKEA